MGDNDSADFIREGTIECSAPNYHKAYLADHVSCFLFQIPFYLIYIKFGYITSALVFLIIFISIFGRIKLHYRWFILNLALLDLLTTYDFTCWIENSNGFYSSNCYPPLIKEWISDNNYISELPCFGMFILTGSRFASIFYPKIYKKFAKTWKIILIIFIIEFSFTLFNAIINFFSIQSLQISRNCFLIQNKNVSILSQKINECLDNTSAKYDWIYKLQTVEPFFPAGALALSVIFVFLLIIKISKQLKFQATTNKEMLKTNIRIIIVFSIQTILLTLLFILNFFRNLPNIDFLWINISTSEFPHWFQWLAGNDDTIRSFRVIRVFIDSIVVLAFMSGYREDIRDAIIWIYTTSKRAITKVLEKGTK